MDENFIVSIACSCCFLQIIYLAECHFLDAYSALSIMNFRHIIILLLAICSNELVTSLSLLKGYQSSSQHLQKILSVSKMRTMSSVHCWYLYYGFIIQSSFGLQVNVSVDGFKLLFQVKFDNDAIDETDRLEETLKPRVESFGGKVEKIALTGNHITPCVQV